MCEKNRTSSPMVDEFDFSTAVRERISMLHEPSSTRSTHGVDLMSTSRVHQLHSFSPELKEKVQSKSNPPLVTAHMTTQCKKLSSLPIFSLQYCTSPPPTFMNLHIPGFSDTQSSRWLEPFELRPRLDVRGGIEASSGNKQSTINQYISQ